MQIDPLCPSPFVHSPLVADPRNRRPDRRVQSQRSAHRDASLALCAIQGVPQQVVDGRSAGDEGCERGDSAGGGGGVLLLHFIAAAGGFRWWDCGCDFWADGGGGGGGFVKVKGVGVLSALLCRIGIGDRWKGSPDAAAGAEGLVALAASLLRRVG